MFHLPNSHVVPQELLRLKRSTAPIPRREEALLRYPFIGFDTEHYPGDLPLQPKSYHIEMNASCGNLTRLASSLS